MMEDVKNPAIQKDFYIMSRDTATALYREGKLTVLNAELLPLYLKNSGSVENWLAMRAIDSHRANSRLLKKALRLADRDDISTVIAVNAVTITDCYWILPIGSDLKYADVRFDNDYFSALALMGSYDSFNKAALSGFSKTPELTNIGSFEKCWKLRNGQWYMYKRANHEEMFSEIFIYRLGARLGFNMARYERGRGYVKTPDFTNNASVCFEPAYSFMGGNEDYIATLENLKELCPEAAEDYVKMLFLDTICANPDRHTLNFGILRDSNNGGILGLAPNFDNNMALIARGYPKITSFGNDVLIQLFNELLEYDAKLKPLIPCLSEDMIRDVISSIGMRVRAGDITKLVMNRYRLIQK